MIAWKPLFTGIKPTHAFLWCVSIALLLRFPFFFRDYLNWDESTFIIMGQSLADGNLPYTQLWDLKPPLVFYFFSALISFFGKSLFAIRFAGALVIGITSFFVYQAARQYRIRYAGVCAILVLYFSSLFGAIQGVMSEHIAMLPFLAACYLFLFKSRKTIGWLGAAFCFGLAVMCRLNLIYPILFLYIAYAIGEPIPILKRIIRLFMALFTGATVPMLLWLPYYFNDQPTLWWHALILPALYYDPASPKQLLEVALQLIPVFALVFYAGIKFWRPKTNYLRLAPKKYLTILVIGLAYMLITSGKINTHYLVQLYPFLILLIGITFNKLNKRFKRLKWQRIAIVVLLLCPVESYVAYGKLTARALRHKELHSGYTFNAVKYIDTHCALENTVYFRYYHLGYWYLDKTPPSPIVTHPSNLFRKSHFKFVPKSKSTPLEELQYIFEVQKPDILVGRTSALSRFLTKDNPLSVYFDAQVNAHYKLVYSEDNALYIHQRKVSE